MAVIVPHPDYFARVFQSLVDFGVPVREIRTTTDTEYLGLVVADDVYNRWQADGDPTRNENAAQPKRRGRPPKNPAPALEESSPVDEETSP